MIPIVILYPTLEILNTVCSVELPVKLYHLPHPERSEGLLG